MNARRSWAAVVLLVAAAAIAAATVPRQGAEPAARVVRMAGEAWWRPDGQDAWRPLTVGRVLRAGDWVMTGRRGGWVELVFSDGASRILVERASLLQIGGRHGPAPHAELSQAEQASAPVAVFRAATLQLGSLWAYVSSAWDRLTAWEIATPTAVAGVRGTLFRLAVDTAGTTWLYVHQGAVELWGVSTRRLVQAGGVGRAGAGPPTGEPDFAAESRAALEAYDGWPPGATGPPDGDPVPRTDSGDEATGPPPDAGKQGQASDTSEPPGGPPAAGGGPKGGGK